MPEKSDLQKLKTVLEALGTALEDPDVKKALDELVGSGSTSSIVGGILRPVIDGLIKVLQFIKKAINEIGNKIVAVAVLEDKLVPKIADVIDEAANLVEAADIAEKKTLEEVSEGMRKLDILPPAADVKEIKEDIIKAIDAIIRFLEGI